MWIPRGPTPIERRASAITSSSSTRSRLCPALRRPRLRRSRHSIGHEVTGVRRPDRVHEHVVSPGFFATYGMTIAAGRDFDTRDSSGSSRVAIVSESYAAQIPAGSESAGFDARLGALPPPAGPCAVIGVVSDAVFGALRSGPRPSIYLPLAQSSDMVPPGRTVIAMSVRPVTVRPALLAADGRCADEGERPAVVLVPAARAGCRHSPDARAAPGRAVGILCRPCAAAGGAWPLRRHRVHRLPGVGPKSGSGWHSVQLRCGSSASY